MKLQEMVCAPIATLTLIGSLIGGANAALINIGFEDGTGHDVVIPTTNYSGIELSNAVWISNQSGLHDGNYGLGVDAGTFFSGHWGIPGTTSPITIAFDDGGLATTFSIQAFGVGWNGAKIEAFDASGNSLDSDSNNGDGTVNGVGNNPILTVNAVGIKTVQLTQLGDNNSENNSDGLGWDNISATTVPEPSSTLLLGLGSLSLVLRRSRR